MARHGIDGLLMRRACLVAVLGTQVARGALGDVQSFGHSAQVDEVMQTDVMYEASLPRGARLGGRIR